MSTPALDTPRRSPRTVHDAVLHDVTVLGTGAEGATLRAADGPLCITSDLPIGNGNQVLVAVDDDAPAGLPVADDPGSRPEPVASR